MKIIMKIILNCVTEIERRLYLVELRNSVMDPIIGPVLLKELNQHFIFYINSTERKAPDFMGLITTVQIWTRDHFIFYVLWIFILLLLVLLTALYAIHTIIISFILGGY